MFFNVYSIEPEDKKTEERILNQGQILQYLNVIHSVNITKYDVKDIFTKNKITYKSYKRGGKVIFGVRLFAEPIFIQTVQNEQDIPF